MNAALLSVLLLLGAPGGSPSSEDLCRCVNYRRTIEVRATLAQAGVKGNLETELEQAGRKAALRGAFASAFCGTQADAFERVDQHTIVWEEGGCRAGNPSPRVWPELLRIECKSPVWPEPPATFQVTAETWQSRGEELNRVWEKLVSVSSSCKE